VRGMEGRLRKDESAAATELGYVFTFLLGVLLLSMFSVWAWDIENSTRNRWNEQALEDNLRDVAAAIERADAASRLDAEVLYAEPVKIQSVQTDAGQLTLFLDDERVYLIDARGMYSDSITISAASASTHEGEVNLGTTSVVWVVYSEGVTSISSKSPDT
jgi:hypothetical protein